MRYPKYIKKGDTIGFLAPSFGCAVEPYLSGFKNAQKKFEELGYRPVLGPNCYESAGVGISNIPEKCGAEVMEMFGRGDVDCLISCGGGELMCEILPFVDFEKLSEAEPKWFMGYSDNTNLTYLLATLADMASVYGPCAGTFGMEPWHKSLWDALQILTGERQTVGGYGLWEKESLKDEENPLVPYHVTEPLKLRTFVGKKEIYFADSGEEESGAGNTGANSEEKESVLTEVCSEEQSAGSAESCGEEQSAGSAESCGGEQPAGSAESCGGEQPAEFAGTEKRTEPLRFSGRLLGGCLDCLVNLSGTRFDKTKEFAERYGQDGIIWFFEACDLNVFAIRRAMWQLQETGWFRFVKGFLIGRPSNGEEMMGLNAYDAVLEVAGKENVPVVMDVDLGHLPPMMPLVVGSLADVTVLGNRIEVKQILA